jgi:hypothetical protein
MNAYITYSENIDELVRTWRASILHEERLSGIVQLKPPRAKKRFNPLAEEEKIKEDASHPD